MTYDVLEAQKLLYPMLCNLFLSLYYSPHAQPGPSYPNLLTHERQICSTRRELMLEVAFGKVVTAHCQCISCQLPAVGLRSHDDACRLQSVVESKAALWKRYVLPSRAQHLLSCTAAREGLSAFANHSI